MVFENGANEVRDLDLLLAQHEECLTFGDKLDIPLRPSISHFALTANQDRELHAPFSKTIWSL